MHRVLDCPARSLGFCDFMGDIIDLVFDDFAVVGIHSVCVQRVTAMTFYVASCRGMAAMLAALGAQCPEKESLAESHAKPLRSRGRLPSVTHG